MIERWNAENLVSPHPTKMAPMPLGFFPAHCQNDGVRKVNTFDAEADLEWGVCSNVWKTIRGAGSVPLLERPLVMACSGHVRDSPDYDHRRALASHCAENGPWSSFAIAPQEETDFEKFLTFRRGPRSRPARMVAARTRAQGVEAIGRAPSRLSRARLSMARTASCRSS